MPYKLREHHNGNRRLNYRVMILASYAKEGLEPTTTKARADIRCLSCGKVSRYSTPKQYRHYTDCEYALQES